MQRSLAVADVFHMKIQLGSRAPVPLVARLVADLNVVTQGAFEVATHVAESEADAHMAGLVREGGVTALMEEARRRELPLASDEERDLALLGVPVRTVSPAANGGDLARSSLVRVSLGPYGCGV